MVALCHQTDEEIMLFGHRLSAYMALSLTVYFLLDTKCMDLSDAVRSCPNLCAICHSKEKFHVFDGTWKQKFLTVNVVENMQESASDGSVPCCEHAACPVVHSQSI